MGSMNKLDEEDTYDPDELFLVGVDNFEDLEIKKYGPKSVFYFHSKTKGKKVAAFVLKEVKEARFVCKVTLIKKGDLFSPRLEFSKRIGKSIVEEKVERLESSELGRVRARVDMQECHEELWKLLNYVSTLRETDVPKGAFSLISHDQAVIVDALKEKDLNDVVDILRSVQEQNGLLDQDAVNKILGRKERLAEFEKKISNDKLKESFWQDFFDENTWIFGYGLSYRILRAKQSQAYVGGSSMRGAGGQVTDNLMYTSGDMGFTVLVEIKRPNTKLIGGTAPIRSNAWRLSSELIDGLAQLQANIHQWETNGHKQQDNRDALEARRIYTVKPKGILVIGRLDELDDVDDPSSGRGKRETFERFRASVHGVEIITFDELLKRSWFIINH